MDYLSRQTPSNSSGRVSSSHYFPYYSFKQLGINITLVRNFTSPHMQPNTAKILGYIICILRPPLPCPSFVLSNLTLSYPILSQNIHYILHIGSRLTLHRRTQPSQDKKKQRLQCKTPRRPSLMTAYYFKLNQIKNLRLDV
jgi:hypothetical protein